MMLPTCVENFHVCIFGSGISGLLLAQKLVDLNYDVALIEENKRLAAGASTRNEGWLHSGTYHCHSIADRSEAIKVAKQCIHGYKSIISYAPEAIEHAEAPTYALINEIGADKKVRSVWDEAGVIYKEVPNHKVLRDIHKIKQNSFAKAFQVNDVSINTRILYKKLATEITRKGVVLYNGYKSKICKNWTEVELTSTNGSSTVIGAEFFVHATGYFSKEIFEEDYDIQLPIRLWKSHLIFTDKISDLNCFFIDKHEVTIMRHKDKNIIGINDDAELCNSRVSSTPEQAHINKIWSALKERFKLDGVSGYSAQSCFKVDVPKSPSCSRSLDISYFHPENIKNHICIFPGKMSTAPFLAERAANYIYEYFDDQTVSSRPWDTSMPNEI